MPLPPPDKATLQETIDAAARYPSKVEAARSLGCAVTTFKEHLRKATEANVTPSGDAGDNETLVTLRERTKTLEAALRSLQAQENTRESIRVHIFNIVSQTPAPPSWVIREKTVGSLGIPTLFLSDLHWGEVVNPSEIYHANEYNIQIAHQRMRTTIQTAIHLLFDCLTSPKYDGMVLVLGGDMITGNIHEELKATNELEVMPTMVDLFGVIIWVIDTLLEHFGKLYIPCVTGNHGRNTVRIQKKERNATNFDWLLYMLLAKHYEGNAKVTFNIPDGPDCLYKIYGHRYLLTHGDQFRGGDGLIGPIGPLVRGRHKKASRAPAIDAEFDTMVCGHFHTLMQLPQLIVNGSMKGYDEYAYAGNFSFEKPAQALWLTHPIRGITFQMPVYCDAPKKTKKADWVSWAA